MSANDNRGDTTSDQDEEWTGPAEWLRAKVLFSTDASARGVVASIPSGDAAGEFEPFSRDFSHKAKLQSGLTPEMGKYEFLEKSGHQPICPSNALACALDHLWADPKLGCNLAGESLAVYAMNEIASYLWANYDICRLDRRKTERRTAMPDPFGPAMIC